MPRKESEINSSSTGLQFGDYLWRKYRKALRQSRKLAHRFANCWRQCIPAYVIVDLDSYTVPPGGKITGKAVLGINFTDAAAESLQLRIVGFEYAFIAKAPGGAGRPHTWAQTRHPFLDFVCKIRNFKGGQVSRGRHEIPLELELPKDIPNTMRARPGFIGPHFCKIEYFLEMRLIRKGCGWEVVKRVPFEVRGFTDDDVEVNPLIQEVVPVSYYAKCDIFCGLLGDGFKGFVYVGIFLADSVAIAGAEELEVSLAIQNNSVEKIRSVKVYLEETIYFMAEEKMKETRRRLSALTLDVEHLPFDLRPIERANLFQTKKVLPGKLSVNALRQHLLEGTFKVSLPVKKSAKGSVEGTLIRVRHYVVLRVNGVETYLSCTIVKEIPPSREEEMVKSIDSLPGSPPSSPRQDQVAATIEKGEEVISNDEREFA